MLTLTLTVHHAVLVRVVLYTVYGYAATGVAVAEAAASHYHLVQGVVVFFAEFFARVQQIVAECVQFGEVDAQVGYLEQVLDLRRVGVFGLNESGRQY